MSALHNFVRNNNERTLERVLQGALRIRQKEDPDSTTLDSSFVDKKDHHGRTALHIAAYNGNLAITKLLLKFGASPKAVAQDSTTALHFAAQNGNAELIKELCRKDASVNAKTSKSWMTPLHLALSKGNCDAAHELVKKGAIQKYNSKGKLPFDLASEETLSRLRELLGETSFSRLKDDVQDKPKSVKPPVAFYNRKKKPKSKIEQAPSASNSNEAAKT